MFFHLFWFASRRGGLARYENRAARVRSMWLGARHTGQRRGGSVSRCCSVQAVQKEASKLNIQHKSPPNAFQDALAPMDSQARWAHATVAGDVIHVLVSSMRVGWTAAAAPRRRATAAVRRDMAEYGCQRLEFSSNCWHRNSDFQIINYDLFNHCIILGHFHVFSLSCHQHHSRRDVQVLDRRCLRGHSGCCW